MPRSKDLKHGELVAFARYIGEPADKVRRWKHSGKLDGFIKNGKIQKKKAREAVYDSINIKKQQAQNARWNKPEEPDAQPNTESEIADYLDKTVGELSALSFQELQRYNELEKLLLARLKRQREEGEMIPAEPVQKAAFDAGQKIKEQLNSIADRCCSLVAVENDSFECKQILQKEINYVLEGLSKMLEVKT